MKFQGIYYDGVHPVGRDVTVLVNKAGDVKVIGSEVAYQCQWKEVTVSDQLGNTARRIHFPDGSKCETHAHKQVNQLEKQVCGSKFNSLLHRLESHWHTVLIASIVVIGITWGMVVYGIPALAKTVAEALPVSVDERLTAGTLKILDEKILDDSGLDKKIQLRIDKKFKRMINNTNDEHTYRLLFKKGLGPNAFALPSGHIVVTDELVEMADHDSEVLAVLAHEIGHVVHEHGLRSVLQSSAVALLLTAVTGDIGSAGGFAAAMPIILLETNYSRKFELEADAYALDYMNAHDIDTNHFATILQKITGESESDESNPFAYLSTHPATHERIQLFKDNSVSNLQ